MAAAASLAVLYAASAGGLATPGGSVCNPLILAVLERTTSSSISFAQWTSTGVVLAAAHVPICYLVLKWMLPPEVQALPDRRSHVRRQREQLCPLSRGEKNVVSALTLMLVLWMLPTLVTTEFLDIWYAPPAAMALLFLLPVDVKRGEMTLDRKDFQGRRALESAFSGCRRHGAGHRIDLTGGDRLAWGRGHGEPRGDGVAVAGWSARDGGDATGQRHRDDDDGLLDPVSDSGGLSSTTPRFSPGSLPARPIPWCCPGPPRRRRRRSPRAPSVSGTMFRAGVAATVLTSIAIIVLSTILVPAFGAFSVR